VLTTLRETSEEPAGRLYRNTVHWNVHPGAFYTTCRNPNIKARRKQLWTFRCRDATNFFKLRTEKNKRVNKVNQSISHCCELSKSQPWAIRVY